MSNCTIREIATLVAQAYGLEPSAILKQPHGMTITPTAREARCVVYFLGGKHTPWTGRQIIDHMGMSYGGELLRRLTDGADLIAARLASDPGFAALIEGVEQGIDALHESRDAVRQHYQAAALNRKPRKQGPAPPRYIQELELTPEWWASNDRRFRGALLDAAE